MVDYNIVLLKSRRKDFTHRSNYLTMKFLMKLNRLKQRRIKHYGKRKRK